MLFSLTQSQYYVIIDIIIGIWHGKLGILIESCHCHPMCIVIMIIMWTLGWHQDKEATGLLSVLFYYFVCQDSFQLLIQLAMWHKHSFTVGWQNMCSLIDNLQCSFINSQSCPGRHSFCSPLYIFQFIYSMSFSQMRSPSLNTASI